MTKMILHNMQSFAHRTQTMKVVKTQIYKSFNSDKESNFSQRTQITELSQSQSDVSFLHN